MDKIYLHLRQQDQIETRAANERARQKSNAYHRVAHSLQRDKALTHYGGKCVCCGETTQEFLSIDHINGGGNKHRQEIGIGQIYRWLEKNNYPTDFQVLCYNCNLSIGFNGYCPHQRK